MQKHMDHAAYQRKMKRKTFAELMFIARDATEAAEAMPEGPNAGYYADEAHYALMEMKRRQS